LKRENSPAFVGNPGNKASTHAIRKRVKCSKKKGKTKRKKRKEKGNRRSFSFAGNWGKGTIEDFRRGSRFSPGVILAPVL